MTTKKKVVALKLPTTLKLSTAMTIPAMRLCLVAYTDNRIDEVAEKLKISGARVKLLALTAVALSKKVCYFCGATSIKEQLCPCLGGLRSKYKERQPWKAVVSAHMAEINKQVANSPEREAAQRLAADSVIRQFGGPNAVVFENDCKCGTHVTVTAGLIAFRLRKFGNYTQSWRCQACGLKAKEARAAKTAAPAVPAPSHAVKAPKKKQKVREFQRTVAPADVQANGLEVSLGEQLKFKLSPAEAKQIEETFDIKLDEAARTTASAS